MIEIPLSKTNLVPNIVLDYLNHSELVNDLYQFKHEIESYKSLIQNHHIKQNQRQLLKDNLLNQYNQCGIELGSDSKVLQNINLLSEPNTFTITTGHQLVLAGGPLFVAYKILTAIKVCIDLKKLLPEYNFVPILWLASEDHDFEEISEIFIFNKSLKWRMETNNMPVGTLTLETLKNDILELIEIIDKNETGRSYTELLKKCYLESSNLSEASIKWFHNIFKEYGLVVLEPNQKGFKTTFIDFFKADIFENRVYYNMLEMNKNLEQKAYKPTINAREINTFFIHKDLGRKLIKRNDKAFYLADSEVSFNESELETLLKSNPELFSPNVCLRPVYQEFILPNLAYIGGPAEVAYWLQLKNVFKGYNLNMPVVLLRQMILMLGSGLKNKVIKSGIEFEDFLNSDEHLKKQFLKINKAEVLSDNIKNTLDAFQKLIENAREIDEQTAKEILETKLSIKEYLEQKKKSFAKKILEKQDSEFEKVKKVKEKLYPKGIFQERIESLMQYECIINKKMANEILNSVEENNDKLIILDI
ncbi:MAG: bacillithiol biosynthesis cysteine-adding enzyme BshC [Bacteroidia bacterium]